MNKIQNTKFPLFCGLLIAIVFTSILIACPVDPPKDKGGGDDDNNTVSCPTVGPTPTAPADYTKPTTTVELRAEVIKRIGASTSTTINTANLNYIDTSAITDMTGVFAHVVDTTFVSSVPEYHEKDAFNTFNGDISAWDTSSVTKMNNIFKKANAFNGDMCSWNTSKVTDMSKMFNEARAFNRLLLWDVKAVTNMSSMFNSAWVFNQPLESWNVGAVENMGSMFNSAKKFNQPIGNWIVSAVTNMSSMFQDAEKFNQPIGKWNVSAVETMNTMFSGAEKFDQPLADWDVGNVTTIVSMFRTAINFDQDLDKWGDAPGNFNTRTVTKKAGLGTGAFKGSARAGNEPSWCTGKPGGNC